MIDWLSCFLPVPADFVLPGSIMVMVRDVRSGAIISQKVKCAPVEGSYSDKCVVQYWGNFEWPDGGRVVIKRTGGRVQRSKVVDGLLVEDGRYPFVADAFTDRSSPFRALYISGNPSKFLTGQNVAFSSNVDWCVSLFVRGVFRALRLPLPAVTAEALELGLYRLSRIDYTHHYDCSSEDGVREWLRGAAHFARTRAQSSAFSDGTLYFGKDSQKIITKFYYKFEELKRHPLLIRGPVEAKIYNGLVSQLRCEVCFRGPWLKRRGIEWGYLLRKVDLEALYMERVQSLKIPSQFEVSSLQFKTMKGTLRAVYLLWLRGDDLRTVYPRRTLYRLRSRLLEYQIDIFSPRPTQEIKKIPAMSVIMARQVEDNPPWLEEVYRMNGITPPAPRPSLLNASAHA